MFHLLFLYNTLYLGGIFVPKTEHGIFTESALWAGSVIELRCLFVCLCVIKFVIVNYGQTVRVFLFIFIFIFIFYFIFFIRCRVLEILNLEGHQNCIISSKGKTILQMFFHPADYILRVKMCLLR